MKDLDVTHVPSILQRAADKAGFVRSRYVERDIPTSMQKITVMTFFGNINSTAVVSSLLLRRYREELKGSKYFILCGWPGCDGLFPYVNEYWSVRDDGVLPAFYADAANFVNTSNLDVSYSRNLNYFFDDNLNYKVFEPYYNNGFKQGFFDKFKVIKRYLPVIPSITSVGMDFVKLLSKHREPKVFVYPSTVVYSLNYGKLEKIKTTKEFWIALCDVLLDNGFCPVLYKGFSTHDLSADFTDSCLNVNHTNLLHVASVMRACDCVLDFFSGISKLAIIARSPFLTFDERTKYNELKEYEFDDLCGVGIPRNYVFSFANLVNNEKNVWKSNYFDLLISRLNSFIPTINRDALPSTSELFEPILYENVKKRKSIKLGARFIKKEL